MLAGEYFVENYNLKVTDKLSFSKVQFQRSQFHELIYIISMKK
jgi:hypothetical protein